MRRNSSIAWMMALTMAALVTVEAQRRGGAPPAGARGGGPPGPRAGKIEHITVHGKSLEGNLEGDSPDREVTVYLPPSYAGDQARRYPVVYLLHGYGGRDDTFTEPLAQAARKRRQARRRAGLQRARSSSRPMRSRCTRAACIRARRRPATGRRFVAEDLVAYVDGHYRTLANRMSRGLAGHSMGGYGALRIGMKRPDVFSSLYIMSACCLTANANPRPEAMAPAEAIKTREQAEEAARARGSAVRRPLASAAAWSPNPENPPLYLDLPVKDGKVRPDIVAKWDGQRTARDARADTCRDLKPYYAIAIEVGTKDTCSPRTGSCTRR